MLDVPTLVLLLLLASAAVVVAGWTKLSYTLVLLVFGLIVGSTSVAPQVTPSADIILLLFLPPLIFEGAYALDARTLWSVRLGVASFALPGVLFSAAAGGLLVHFAVGLPWTEALLFGSLIAATDPIAVLSTFRNLGVSRRLSVLVEGESLFNDGVALVLVLSLADAVEGHATVATGAVDLVTSIIGGTVIGAVLGWVAHWLIASVDQHLAEMAVSMALAYGAFLAAEELHVSGVLATIAAALTLKWLGRRRGWIYTGRSQELLPELWEFLAFVANAGLFLLIGLEVSVAGLSSHIGAVIWGIITALAGRAIVSYGGATILGWLRFPLTMPEQHIVFWGGLRGGVALAGVLSLSTDFPYRNELLAMTYGVVLFTLLVQGLTIGPLVRALGLGQTRPKVGIMAEEDATA